MYKIELIPGMGRGLVATQDIPAGTVVVANHLHIFSMAETDDINLNYIHSLRLYTFKYTDYNDCLCLGDGELFNHSDSPNVGYKLKHDEVLGDVMVFTTLNDVKAGEQLFIDYTQDDPSINIEEYLK